MELQGKIKLIEETKTYGDNGFRKRGMVITTEEQYPQSIMIEFVQDKVDLIDKYKVGDDVKVGINVGGREWVNPQGETKYFNSISGWRVDAVASSELKPFEPAPVNNAPDPSDDLPF
jgi:hypothetical protein